MKLDLGDKEFVADLVAWLQRIDDDRIASFRAVMEISPGYFPTTLFVEWERELKRRGLSSVQDEETPASQVGLPVGHPLDYDWRFSTSTRELLAQIVRELPAGLVVAYLGSPTLFAELAGSDNDHRHVLIDANEAMVDALRTSGGEVHLARLGFGTLDGVPKVDFLVLDPPWYADAFVDFVTAAARIAKPAARLVISQPTLATRPGVREERVRLVAAAERLGWTLDPDFSATLRYATPHFERLTIADQIPYIALPPDWRRGELLSFHFTGRATENPARTSRDEIDWIERVFGPVRIKLRSAGDGDLRFVAPGVDRLANVSRRDPLRERVGFWTSGNRVRTLTNVVAVGECIALCHADLEMARFTHLSGGAHAKSVGLDPRVGAELSALLLVEYDEHVAAGYGVAG